MNGPARMLNLRMKRRVVMVYIELLDGREEVGCFTTRNCFPHTLSHHSLAIHEFLKSREWKDT